MDDLDNLISSGLSEFGIEPGEDSPQSEKHHNKKIRTSDSFKNEVKQFIDNLEIQHCHIKERSYQIIYNIIKDFELPQKDNSIRYRIQQSINLTAIILKMVDKHGFIDDLVVTSYTFNREALGCLCDLFRSGRIKKMSIWLASSYSFRDPKYYQEIIETIKGLNSKNAKLAFAWMHMKITLAKCGSDFYQHEGSMNYSKNNMAENLIVTNCKKTYQADKNFIDNIMLNKNASKAVEKIC